LGLGSKNSADIYVEVESTINNSVAKTIKIQLKDDDEKVVWQKETDVNNNLKFDFKLKNPKLWWPNGSGEHPIYKLSASLFDANGKQLHSKEVITGIRTVKIEEIKDGPGSSSFTIVINGKRIYAKGANWVPASPFPATVTNDKYELLLNQFQDAGFNMMREVESTNQILFGKNVAKKELWYRKI